MLYIINSIIVIIWTIYIIKKEKYNWHGIICTYFFALIVVDSTEIIFNQLLSLYKFPTFLLNEFSKDNQLGIVFSDGIILPLTTIIFCHYATKKQYYWRLAFIFTFLWHTPLEWIYHKLGYVKYENWRIWYSMLIYLAGFRFLGPYAKRILTYNPPLPYFIRMGNFTYGITAWIGALLGGALISLYQWRPMIFKKAGADDRFLDLSLSWLLALLLAIIIPKVLKENRQYFFMGIFILVTAFSYFSNWQGWLIYHNWNHLCTALRWFIPFSIIVWYDRWETKLQDKSAY